MSDLETIKDQHRFDTEFQSKAEELVELLKQGEMPQSMLLVQQLNEMRHQALYYEVGRLTRAVHSAIVGFTEDVGSSKLLQDSKHHIASVADASDRLSYVIELTESNAHKTIDQVEESLQLVDRLEVGFARRNKLLAALKSGKPEVAALYEKASDYAEDHSDALVELRDRLTGILLAQEYQDITGQLIKRVIQLVTDIEDQLVGLMEVASRVNSLSSLPSDAPDQSSDNEDEKDKKLSGIEAEGPQMAGRSKTEVASCQDDVDDLLSSLGF